MTNMPRYTAKLVRAYPPMTSGKSISTISVLYKTDDAYAGLFNVGSLDISLCGWRMIKLRYPYSSSDPVWMPFEWVNPPMDLGVEYRTVERSLGKPVYVKAVNLGTGPDSNTLKSVDHNIVGLAHIVDFGGEMYVSASGTNPISLPGISNRYTENYHFGVDYVEFIWRASATRLTDYTGIGWIKYTKTTD